MGDQVSAEVRHETRTARPGEAAGERELRAPGPEEDAVPPTVVRLTLPARPENIALVRHVVEAVSRNLPVEAATVEDMRLAVTEACTNVVRHAYPGGDGPLDVVIRPRIEALQVVVSDSGRGMGGSVDRAGPGFGLGLIAALTDELSVEEAPRAGSRLAMTFSFGPRSSPADQEGS